MLNPRLQNDFDKVFSPKNADARKLMVQAEKDAKAGKPPQSTDPVYLEEYSQWRTWMMFKGVESC